MCKATRKLRRYFNPRPPRGGRRMAEGLSGGQKKISIHVLREEDDPSLQRSPKRHKLFQSTSSARRTTKRRTGWHGLCRISIHVLREEDDTTQTAFGLTYVQFQSTSSARRTTLITSSNSQGESYFNPRPPRGGRLVQARHLSDIINFNPRPPRGGRLPHYHYFCKGYYISIHVLREEDDRRQRNHAERIQLISIHVLREEDDAVDLARTAL